MKQIHKKVFIVFVFIAAALIGILSALFPVWEWHQEQRQQEALLLRLEQTAGSKTQESDSEILQFQKMQNAKAAADREAAVFSSVQETQNNNAAVQVKTVEKIKNAVTEKNMPEPGAGIGILTIPKIDATLPVTAGVNVEQLRISEGWVMQTAPIGSAGNAVVAGHRSYTWGQHFNRLGEMENSDEIIFTTTEGETMRFTVTEILTVEPDDPVVFAAPPAGVAQLTLYTCTPVRTATHRLIVRAQLEE